MGNPEWSKPNNLEALTQWGTSPKINEDYAMLFSVCEEISSPRSLQCIAEVGQQVFCHMTLFQTRELVRKNSGDTFVVNGTNRSEGLPLLSTPNRIYVYCSLQHEFSSPKNKDDSSSDGTVRNQKNYHVFSDEGSWRGIYRLGLGMSP